MGLCVLLAYAANRHPRESPLPETVEGAQGQQVQVRAAIFSRVKVEGQVRGSKRGQWATEEDDRSRNRGHLSKSWSWIFHQFPKDLNLPCDLVGSWC